ncbi:MAG TPA: VTT domain-containing protein [Dehalococcoidales bacterium]|nr:VTT domain-containing protein [Dehalococcoidales bacterium]
MSETAEGKVSKWAKLQRIVKRWEYWIGVAGVVLTVGVVVAVINYFDDIQAIGGYGYLGAFLIGVFGGATYIAPVPMLPVIFVLGTVLKPSFAPYLGPVFVGAAAGLGETIGALTIYMTGYGGGAALASAKHPKIRAVYSRILGWMERRGALVLFIFSAVVNPFFYPIALTAGATHYSLKKYILICIVGKTIKGITVAAAGYWGLGSILRALGLPI